MPGSGRDDGQDGLLSNGMAKAHDTSVLAPFEFIGPAEPVIRLASPMSETDRQRPGPGASEAAVSRLRGSSEFGEGEIVVPLGKGRRRRVARLALVAVFVAAPAAIAQTPSSTDPRSPATRQGAVPGKPASAINPYRPNRFAGKAGRYYKLFWGVDSLSVKLVESGMLVRFSWRVLDPERARSLSDKKVEPALVDPQAGVSLVVPTVEKIGQLRQSTAPEAGKSYWMVFSNKGRLVKRGDRVNVVIGEFRAEGLAVD